MNGLVTNSLCIRAPTHAGGLFAIDRKYFLELGAYDPGLLVWGGENFELSFKVRIYGSSMTIVTKTKQFLIDMAVWWKNFVGPLFTRWPRIQRFYAV